MYSPSRRSLRRIAILAFASFFTTLPTLANPPSSDNSTAKSDATTSLAERYALKDDQILRIMKPPFASERSTWITTVWGDDPNQIHSLGFYWNNDQLIRSYVAFNNQSLTEIALFTLELPWYRVQGLTKIKFPPLHADIVVRKSATQDEKLQALVNLIKQETKQSVEFKKVTQTRPCITLAGSITPGFDSPGHAGQTAAVLTQKPWNDEERDKWMSYLAKPTSFPKTARRAGNFRDASKFLDAPFPDPDQNPSLSRANMLFLIAEDAHLDHTAPDYLPKLQSILDNLKLQIGADWTTTSQDLEVLELHPQP
jgi:hypothetical protein